MFRFYVAATLDRDLAFGIGIWHLWGYRKPFARLPITEPRVSSIARVRVSLAGAAAEKADCHAEVPRGGGGVQEQKMTTNFYSLTRLTNFYS